ncbi:hypothetical protein [Persephonella sp.]
MYIGVNINDDNTFTVSSINKDRIVFNISHFWREGFYWFIEHTKASVITININMESKNSVLKFRYLTEIMNTLLENFEFEQLEMKRHITDEKYVAVTDTDLFFKQIVSKDLLPLESREGIEQRIYNLSKAGVIVKDGLFSTDREKLKKEVNAVASSYTSLAVSNGDYYVEEIEGINLIVPEYRYVPKSERAY